MLMLINAIWWFDNNIFFENGVLGYPWKHGLAPLRTGIGKLEIIT
jgi:hypothetical protein